MFGKRIKPIGCAALCCFIRVLEKPLGKTKNAKMKTFTEKDLKVIFKNSDGSDVCKLYFADSTENSLFVNELAWQKRGLQQTSTGYGSKLTSRYMINFEGKLRRIYQTCYSNVASSWFTYQGKRIYVD